MFAMLETQRLLDAKRDVRELVAEGVRRLESGDDPEGPWIEQLLSDHIPSSNAGYWVIVLRAAQDRTIGVVEAWLDNATIGDELREHLTALLHERLAAGEGAELDERGLGQLVADLLGRTVELSELLGPMRFVLEVLDLTDSEDIHQIVLGG